MDLDLVICASQPHVGLLGEQISEVAPKSKDSNALSRRSKIRSVLQCDSMRAAAD